MEPNIFTIHFLQEQGGGHGREKTLCKFEPWKATTCLGNEVMSTGFYLGFIVWGWSPEWPKAMSFLGGAGGLLPRKFLEMNMRWDGIWCILRPNFEKCYSGILFCFLVVITFWYSYLYTVMITIFFGGTPGILGGGSFYPLNTLDRTLVKEIAVKKKWIPVT